MEVSEGGGDIYLGLKTARVADYSERRARIKSDPSRYGRAIQDTSILPGWGIDWAIL